MSTYEAITTDNFNTEAIRDGNDNKVEAIALRGSSHGQLRRMPHVFCKILDLPFATDTKVVMEERKDAYMFVIRQPGLVEADVVAEVVQIVPGAIKVILRGADRIRAALTKNSRMATENWRARLPQCTIPEAATATYAHGIITITIPKLLPAGKHPPPSARSSTGCSQEMKRSLICLV